MGIADCAISGLASTQCRHNPNAHTLTICQLLRRAQDLYTHVLTWTTFTEMGWPCSLRLLGFASPGAVLEMLGSSSAPSSMLSMLRSWLFLSRSRDRSTLLKGVKPCMVVICWSLRGQQSWLKRGWSCCGTTVWSESCDGC